MMLPLDFAALAQQCAPQVSLSTMAALVRTESGFNPYAIGVVRGRLVRQPSSEAEAVSTAHALSEAGWNYSVGLAQVNRSNWPTYELTEHTAFDPCRNLAAGSAILHACFVLARRAQMTDRPDTQAALRASLSCYESGDFSTGYRTGYVQRVVDNARTRGTPPSSEVVPPIVPIPVVPIDPEVPANRARSKLGENQISEPVSVSPGRASEPDSSAVVF